MTGFRRLGRLAFPIGLVAFCGASAWLALGAPDLTAAGAFEAGQYPTQQGALAAVIVLAWIPIVALGLVLVALLVRSAWTEVDGRQWVSRRRTEVGLVLAIGVIVLGVGVARHFVGGQTYHGGSVARAQHLLKAHK
ncbi:MAG: hypothetical protein ACYCZN_01955 [Candidatus Dormibacteria bacterium]